MNEKEMVNDILSSVNASAADYARAIVQSSNGQLRSTLQQMRDGDERFQYDLYKIAEQKGYYKPAQPASQNDMQTTLSNLKG